jgi:uncharacterized repeat protein (TIGR03806 family)
MPRRLFLPLLLGLAGCESCDDDPTFTSPPPALDGVGLERMWPSLSFERPLLVTTPESVRDRLFVVQQDGRIYAIDGTEAAAAATPFLDLRESVTTHGNEQGLLGLAFHPDYVNNGRLFVNYTRKGDGRTIIAEHRRSPTQPDVAAPEPVGPPLLEQEQPEENHNGGALAFGPDGKLYVGFGDGGGQGDPNRHAQNPSSRLGKIVRVDVDTRQAEIFALGLRNPWRISFDPLTDALWVGDVGWERWEEINVVTQGGNYGWPKFEGREEIDADASAPGHIEPIVAYGRNLAKCITGGHVYRGASIPRIQGMYVFGDFSRGTIWGLPAGGGEGDVRTLVESGKQLSSFGTDADGELYVCAFDGGVYKLVPALSQPPPDFPKTLTELGVLVGDEPTAGVRPYEVNAPLWSDGADKERFLRVPEGQRIGFSERGRWAFPEGTVVAKTFFLTVAGTKRLLETRIIRKKAELWEAASYVWDEAGREAELALEGATLELGEGTRWTVPSWRQCRDCHTDAAGFVLGIETAQIHRGTQLETWSEEGLFEAALEKVADLPALADPYDASQASVEERARAYLHANCAQCHLPGGPGNATIDLRWSTPLEETRLFEPAHQGKLGKADFIVKKGVPEESTLVQRMGLRGKPGAMPPLATEKVDAPAVTLLTEWVKGLE